GATAALGWGPGDVLIWILDVAGLAVNAVLRVDHEAGSRWLFEPLVNTCRTVAGGRSGEDVVLRSHLQGSVGNVQMRRLVLLVIDVGEEHRRQPIEGHLSIGLWIVQPPVSSSRLERQVIRLAVAERSERGPAAEETCHPHVDAAQSEAKQGAVARPERLGVPH